MRNTHAGDPFYYSEPAEPGDEYYVTDADGFRVSPLIRTMIDAYGWLDDYVWREHRHHRSIAGPDEKFDYQIMQRGQVLSKQKLTR